MIGGWRAVMSAVRVRQSSSGKDATGYVRDSSAYNLDKLITPNTSTKFIHICKDIRVHSLSFKNK